MPQRTTNRSHVGTPGKSSFERSARRWYVRRKQSILFGCRIVLLSFGTAFLLSRLWTTKYTTEPTGPTSRCTPRPEDFKDSIGPLYRTYTLHDPSPPPFPVLEPALDVQIDCLEEWLVTGRTDCKGDDLKSRMDVVWTWVNGSDPKWKEELSRASREEGIFSPGFHYRQVIERARAEGREQNELQYSIRSVMAAMPSGLGTVHLVVADYPLHTTHGERDDNRSRIAQTPAWLDFGQVGCSQETPRFQLSTHSEIFHLPARGLMDQRVEEDWREKALPTFNSKAIESRLGWLQGLNEAVLSFNDDFFLLRPHATTDFYSSLYGTVIRFDEGFYQQVRPILDPRNLNDAGETGGLWHANYLLSKRFPKRLRPYLPHVPKVVTRSLHHEAGLMFEDHLFNSTQRRFRESTKGSGDIQLQWLLISLRVERWREALLWTYIVANLGTRDDNGLLGPRARASFARTLGTGDADRLDVVRGARSTLRDMRENLVRAGLGTPQATEMIFSSLDGHLSPMSRPGMPASDNKCTLDLAKCFGAFWTEGYSTPAVDTFKRITFEHPDCGDCLIMALVTASGPSGLSAFMPNRHSAFVNRAPSQRVHLTPLLPITDTWQAANFSLASVMSESENPGSVNLRQYTVKLLARYLYVSGHSKTEFHMIKNPSDASRALSGLDPEAAMLGLNDNIERDGQETKEVMTNWFQRRWPERTKWERQ